MSAIWSGRAGAQGAVGANLVLGRVPAFPQQWSTDPAFASLLVTNTTGEGVRVTVTASVLRDGVTVASAPSDVTLIPAGGVVYTGAQIARWRSLALQGETGDAVRRTGRLLEGPFVLCVSLSDMTTTTTARSVRDTTSCRTFRVTYPLPPRLVLPAERSTVATLYPSFQWTPVVTPGAPPSYFLRLVEILPGQTPAQAIDANFPLFETVVTRTLSLLYPPFAPHLVAGHLYAWRVQAVEAPPVPRTAPLVPVGSNEGRSEVFTFVPATVGTEPMHAPPGGTSSSWLPPDTAPSAANEEPSPSERSDGAASSAAAELEDGPHGVWALAHVELEPELLRHRSENAGPGTALAEFSDVGDPLAQTDDLAPSANSGAPPAGGIPTSAADSTGARPPRALDVRGTFTVSGESYDRSGAGPSARPPSTGRVTTNLTLRLFHGLVDVPIVGVISGDQRAFHQSINQVGLDPSLNWMTLHAGHMSPQYSPFTLADATMLGGGFDAAPGAWRASLATGRSRKAIPWGSPGTAAAYERNVTAARLGFGALAGNGLEISAAHVEDDAGSLDGQGLPQTTPPQQSTAFGLKLQRVLGGRARIVAELARSLYVRDVRSGGRSADGNAAALRLNFGPATSSIEAAVEYVDPSFVTLANSQLQSDHVDFSLTGHTEALDHRLLLTLAGGWRADNLAKDLATTGRDGHFNLGASWQPTPQVGLDATVAANECGSDGRDTVLTVQSTGWTASLAPRVAWTTGAANHSLAASAALQRSDNASTGTISFTDVETRTLVASYSLAWPRALGLSLVATHTHSEADTAVTTLWTMTPGASWSFLDGRVTTLVQIQLTRARVSGTGLDEEATPSLELGWSPMQGHRLALRGSLRRYRFGTQPPLGSDFDEQTATLEYTATLR